MSRAALPDLAAHGLNAARGAAIRALFIWASLSLVWLLLQWPDGVRASFLHDYAAWWRLLLSGDWGVSWRTGERVLDGLLARAPATALLLVLGTGAAVLACALTLWVYARASPTGAGLLTACLRFSRALPVFVVALVLVSVLSYQFNVFPAIVLRLHWDDIGDVASAMAMPLAAVILTAWALLGSALLRQRAMADIGARECARRALRSAFTSAGWLVSLVIIAEAVFSLPGIGRWMVMSLRFNDADVVQGVCVLMVLACALLQPVSGQGASARASASADRAKVSADGAGSRAAPPLVTILWLPVVWLLAVMLAAAFPSLAGLADPQEIDLAMPHAPPSTAHWLGTDALGRDMLSLGAHGSRASLYTAALTAGLGGALALTLLAVSRVPAAAIASLPACLLLCSRTLPPFIVVLLLARLGWAHGAEVIAIGLAVLLAPALVSALDAGGRLGLRHARKLAGAAAGLFAAALGLLASLGYLRLGIEGSAPGWGAAISQGREHLAYAPEMVWIPATLLVLTLLAALRIADALQA